MSISEVLLIALALAVDAFTVGVAVGIKHRQPRQIFRLSFHFGLFQALLPLVGALIGSWLNQFIASYSHFVALVLLSIVGGKMIYEAIYGDDDSYSVDPTKGLSLILLSVAVSIDALAVGFTLGLTEVSILFVVAIVGIVAALCTFVGMTVAGKIASKVGKKIEPLAGLVLIGMGIKAVLEYYI